jgi:hypothetical protein
MDVMTGPEHYAEAGRLLADAGGKAGVVPAPLLALTVAQAQVHATLALAAATALRGEQGDMPADDRAAWVRLASEAPRANARRREAEQAELAELDELETQDSVFLAELDARADG